MGEGGARPLGPLELQLLRATVLLDGDVTQLERAERLPWAMGRVSAGSGSPRNCANAATEIEALDAMGDRGQIALHLS